MENTAEKIADLLASCRDEAIRQGFDPSTAFEPTPADMRYVVDALGFKPTREDWKAGSARAQCCKQVDGGTLYFRPARISQHGGLLWEGRELTAEQEVYVDTDPRDTARTVYRATAQDAEGNRYMVIWALKPGIEALAPEDRPDDEALYCDWSNPERVEMVESAEG